MNCFETSSGLVLARTVEGLRSNQLLWKASGCWCRSRPAGTPLFLSWLVSGALEPRKRTIWCDSLQMGAKKEHKSHRTIESSLPSQLSLFFQLQQTLPERNVGVFILSVCGRGEDAVCSRTWCTTNYTLFFPTCFYQHTRHVGNGLN